MPRVAVIFWDGYLGVAPSIINAARCFVEHGYGVDVITREVSSDFAEVPALGPSVRVLKWCSSSQRRSSQVTSAWAFLVQRLSFVAFALRRVGLQGYTTIIGVDLNGLVTALALALLSGTRPILWSLEIHALPSRRSLRGRISRFIRQWTFRTVPLVVVQNEHRAQLLVEQYGVRGESIVLVPNAPMGEAQTTSSHFLHERCGLEVTSKIALHLGMISPTAFSAELATAAREWPDEWTLVFHERQRRAAHETYLSDVRARGGGRAVMSLEPVPYDDLDAVVASAKIGLALYDPVAGLTYSSPGSSGKIGHYLRCGVPVISLEAPGITEIVEKYECGITVARLTDITDAIKAIDGEWDRFSANALRCYREVYEFRSHFRELMRRLPAS